MGRNVDLNPVIVLACSPSPVNGYPMDRKIAGLVWLLGKPSQIDCMILVSRFNLVNNLLLPLDVLTVQTQLNADTASECGIPFEINLVLWKER